MDFQCTSSQTSQISLKASGVCSVCGVIRQLHVKDGRVHLHGPRNNPCPGSNQPPGANITQPCSQSTKGNGNTMLGNSQPAAPSDSVTDHMVISIQLKGFSHPSLK